MSTTQSITASAISVAPTKVEFEPVPHRSSKPVPIKDRPDVTRDSADRFILEGPIEKAPNALPGGHALFRK